MDNKGTKFWYTMRKNVIVIFEKYDLNSRNLSQRLENPKYHLMLLEKKLKIYLRGNLIQTHTGIGFNK